MALRSATETFGFRSSISSHFRSTIFRRIVGVLSKCLSVIAGPYKVCESWKGSLTSSSGSIKNRPELETLRKISQFRHLARRQARAHRVQCHIHAFFGGPGQAGDINGRAGVQGDHVAGFFGSFVVAAAEGGFD